MNTLLTNLLASSKNPHVALPVLLAAGLSIAEIWVPEQYDNKLHKTEQVLVFFGIIGAANSGPKDTDEEKK